MSEYLTPTENLTGNLTPVDTMNGIIHAEDVLTGQLGIAGGGAGTSNYNDLTNKPSINNVTLQGNKTTADLGLFSGNLQDINYSDLRDDGVLWTSYANGKWGLNSPASIRYLSDVDYREPMVATDDLLAATNHGSYVTWGKKTPAAVTWSGDYDDLANKPTLATVATSGNYNDLTNKPSFTTWQYYGSILSETGIAASLTYNDYIKMAIIRISGSASTPAQSTYRFQLPAFCTPVMELQCYARYMAWLTVSVNRDVVIRGVDTTQAWQSGSILFPYQ